jgi:hypothetical protein
LPNLRDLPDLGRAPLRTAFSITHDLKEREVAGIQRMKNLLALGCSMNKVAGAPRSGTKPAELAVADEISDRADCNRRAEWQARRKREGL